MTLEARNTQSRVAHQAHPIGDGQAFDIATSLGFQESGKEWFVYRIPYLTVHSGERFSRAGMQVYLPTYSVTIKDKNGKKKIEQKPKVLNYLFVLATCRQVDEFFAKEGVCPLYRHRVAGEWEERQRGLEEAQRARVEMENQFLLLKTRRDELRARGEADADIEASYKELHKRLRNLKDMPALGNRWLTVPPVQMHSLMKVIQGHERELEFYAPAGHLLDKGDRVRIVSGPFAGVEGILLTRQGKKGGEVYVALTNVYGAKTAHISNEHLKVLEFSRHTDHFYRKIEAFQKTLEQALLLRKAGHSLGNDMRAELEFFLFRYEHLSNLTHVNAAKLAVCSYVACMLLEKRNRAECFLRAFAEETELSKERRRAARRSPSAQKYINHWVEQVETCLLHRCE